MSLEALRISEAPAAFAAMAAKHNLLVDLVASLTGEAGIKVTVSAGRILITGTAPWTTAQIYDIAYNAAVDAALAGDITIDAAHVTDFDAAAVAAVLPITSADVTDFDAAAVAAVLPITSADVTDFDAAAVAAVLPITSADVTDFDAAAVAAVLPITSADVTDFDAAAVAAVLPITSADVTDFDAAAAAVAPVQSVAGRTGNVVITAGDLSDFNANVDLRIANIASVDVINSDSKIAKVMRHPANYVTPTDYPAEIMVVAAAGNISLNTTGLTLLKTTGGYAAALAFASLARDMSIGVLDACANGTPANIDTIVSNTY